MFENITSCFERFIQFIFPGIFVRIGGQYIPFPFVGNK